MTFEISEETRAQTTKCDFNFACLYGGGECLKCIVERVFGETSCLLKSGKRQPCHYLAPFADTWFCTCPTRAEIYNKYGL